MFSKQSIKQFLKPDKKKILVFVIFGIILSFAPMVFCHIYSDTLDENLLISPFKYVLSTIQNIFSPLATFPGCEPSVDCSWGLTVSMCILFYILSCFVVFVYNKNKIKPKKS